MDCESGIEDGLDRGWFWVGFDVCPAPGPNNEKKMTRVNLKHIIRSVHRESFTASPS